MAAGVGMPVGSGAACTACEIWQRSPGTIESVVLPSAQLAAWVEALEPPARQRLESCLTRLRAPPNWPAGLPDRRPLIMGVVNVTPDSFSDGGLFLAPEAAIAQGLRLREEGADIVDVGGESTRPGAEPVAVEQEIRRVVPVIEALAAAGGLVSIDTRKAAVMRAAIDVGARLINDVSALRHDPESLTVAGASGLPVILMHSRGEPATMQQHPVYERAVLDVFDHLEARIGAWRAAGFDPAQLMVDPGIGFGKTVEHNLDILRRLSLYLSLGVPLVLGVSRKSFIARLAGKIPAPERVPGSLAAALYGLAQGVAILRVHDVAATRQAVTIWQALCA